MSRGPLDWHPFDPVPAERLAALRLLVGGFTLVHLASSWDLYQRVARSEARHFRPLGVLSWLAAPVPAGWVSGLLFATLVSTVLFTAGVRHRPLAALHALALLVLVTYRNCWSMVYHSHHLLVLHTLLLAAAPAAEAWSLDAWADPPRPRADGWVHGWAVWLLSAVTAVTYVLAGLAKVAGPLGWAWAAGTSLREQIAADAIRKELLGGEPAALAFALFPHVGLLTALGVGALALELGAPLALLRRRLAAAWAGLALALHWGIYLAMGIEFAYHLSGIALASFLPVEQVLRRRAAA